MLLILDCVCTSIHEDLTHTQVGRHVSGVEGHHVSESGATDSADLGGSSKYSSEILEDRRGEGFHVNSS